MSGMQPGQQECRPQFLDARDEPWLAALVAEYQRFVGKPVREWRRRLQEPMPYYCPRAKLRFAVKALDDVFRRESRYGRKQIVDLRRQLFLKSNSTPWPIGNGRTDREIQERRNAIAGPVVSEILGDAIGQTETLDTIMFSDLPSERLVCEPNEDPSLPEVMLTANTYLVRSLLERSHRVDIWVRGKVRPVIRQAKLRGLICVAVALPGDTEFEAQLSLSGPLGIFRHARLYGRLLAEVLPFLPNCDRFRLSAVVPVGEAAQTWTIRSGDPIRPAATTAYDSRVERQFAKAFCKAASDFDLVREPLPIAIGRRMIFPDFAIKHRTDVVKTWLLEIVGYWTTAYLEKKIADLRHAQCENLIICVDRKLGVADEWPRGARVVPYEGRIDPTQVLKIITA